MIHRLSAYFSPIPVYIVNKEQWDIATKMLISKKINYQVVKTAIVWKTGTYLIKATLKTPHKLRYIKAITQPKNLF